VTESENTLAYYLLSFISQAPGGQYYKTFYDRNLRILVINKSFQPSLWERSEAYPTVEHRNNRQGWKGLPGTNTLAYYQNP
jgi:hypothetical protein